MPWLPIRRSSRLCVFAVHLLFRNASCRFNCHFALSFGVHSAKRPKRCKTSGLATAIGKPPVQTRQQNFLPLLAPPQHYAPQPPQQQQPTAGPSSSAPFDVRKLGYEDMKRMVDAWQDEQQKAYGDAQRHQQGGSKPGFQ